MRRQKTDKCLRVLWAHVFVFGTDYRLMEVSGQTDAPAALSPGKYPRFPLERRLDWPQSRSGGGGEQKNLFPTPAGGQIPIVQLVA